MTQSVPSAGTAARPRVPNWGRMIRVWGLLAMSMTGAALACWAALPAPPPEPKGGAGALQDGAALLAAVWPKDMLAERPWRFIVIHHTATPGATIEALDQFHRDRDFPNGIAYHFIINNGRSAGTVDGEITATDRWRQQLDGAHCKVHNHPEFNTEGIGVCLVGNFEQQPPTTAQMAGLERLVLALQGRYHIPLERVLAHRELKNTQCPGRLFPMDAFVRQVRETYLRSRLLAPGPAD